MVSSLTDSVEDVGYEEVLDAVDWPIASPLELVGEACVPFKGDAMTHSEDDPRRKFDLNVMAWVGGAVVIILAVIAVYTFSA